jgi:hypothetical protein
MRALHSPRLTIVFSKSMMAAADPMAAPTTGRKYPITPQPTPMSKIKRARVLSRNPSLELAGRFGARLDGVMLMAGPPLLG